LRISAVFFCTKVEKESRLPETFSPLLLAATRVLNRRFDLFALGVVYRLCRVKGCELTALASPAAAAA